MSPIKSLPYKVDYLAPDGSEIRLLISDRRGGLCHCTLPAGRCASAVRHRSVDELWFVLRGRGEIWRRTQAASATIDSISAGDSFAITVATAFQFRAEETLEVLIATIPPWPGPDEAVPVDGGFDDGSLLGRSRA